MKNPFVQMAILAAAMAAAFQEDRARGGVPDMSSFGGHSGRGPAGPRNPAGSKIVRKFYRNHHGVKGDYDEGRKWYAELRP